MHDFQRFPELTNNQMTFYYFESPHEQITGDFFARVVKVTDGDTVNLVTDFRDFKFPFRIIGIDAPEMNADGGEEAKNHLKGLIEGMEVEVLIDPKERVEKWGRLLGDVRAMGMLVSEEMLMSGHAVEFSKRGDRDFLTNLEKEFDMKQWLS